MGHSITHAVFLMESRIAEGADVNLIEAHKWFNLAALGGDSRGQESRAELADYMSAREIAEAQRQARAWLSTTISQAA